MAPIAVSRRRLLADLAGGGAGAAAVALTGCSGPSGQPSQRVAATNDDLDLAREVARTAATLAAAAAGTARRHPQLRSLGGFVERHRAHLAAFTPDGESVARPGRLPVPRSRPDALRLLRARERRVAASVRRAAGAATSGELAAALASCAACLAQHDRLLTDALARSEQGGR